MVEKEPENTETATVFDAVLTPHRSLGPVGFRWLMAIVILISALASLRFYALGAWPVSLFFVVDVALIYLFFRLNYRAARESERLRLTHFDLRFARVDRRGHEREWRFNPLFVRLDRQDHPDYGTLRLALRHRSDEVEIARFLNASERSTFADALNRALGEARAGPRFD
jgi:uncharacterized membrane protein